MSCIVPFFRIVAFALLVCLYSACNHRAATLDDVPFASNPMEDIPEVRAWCGHMPLNMGVDSACALPVVVFPQLASLCDHMGPVRNGFRTAPLGISLVHGREPVVAYSHVVSADGTPVQGLIGWPVIRHYVWHLQLYRNCHYFHRSLPAEVLAWNSLALVGRDVARVLLPGCGECILDTGAPYGLYLSGAEWKRFLHEHPEVRVGIYWGESPAAGGSFVRHYAQVRQLQLGPWLLRDIRVCETFSHLTGPRMLGRESLAQMELWLDAPNARLYYRQR